MAGSASNQMQLLPELVGMDGAGSRLGARSARACAGGAPVMGWAAGWDFGEVALGLQLPSGAV